MVHIAEELEPADLDEVLQAMPAQERVLVEQALAWPEDSAWPDDAARDGGGSAFLDGGPDD